MNLLKSSIFKNHFLMKKNESIRSYKFLGLIKDGKQINTSHKIIKEEVVVEEVLIIQQTKIQIQITN
jgi:hypothetical protein